LETPSFCPDHPDVGLVEDHAAGDLICPECGVVVGERCVDVQLNTKHKSKTTKGRKKDATPDVLICTRCSI
jgi:transcription initiation factor TFIIIB Brf1 subunit/transcription initiation factor TFIIB